MKPMAFCCCAFLWWLAAAHAAGADGAPDYKGYAEKYCAIYTRQYMAVLESNNQNALKAEKDFCVPDIFLTLWQATGKEEYLRAAEKSMSGVMEKLLQPDKNGKEEISAEELSDFGSYPVMHAAKILMDAGKFRPEWSKELKKEVVDARAKGLNFRHGNRELGRLSGPAYLTFKIFPRDAELEPLRRQFNAWWEKTSAVGDLDENSGNYSSLGLTLFVRITRAMGREGDLAKSERWHNTFTRYANMVTPGGQMPEWGDDYFHEGGKLAWVYLLEYGALLYKDPALSFAARKLFGRLEKDIVNQKATSVHWDLHILSDAYAGMEILELKPLGAAEPGLFLCGITKRYDEFGDAKDDKLMLRASLKPGAPAIMMDLYSYGDHAHMDKPGSIFYYEAGQVPLFPGGYGRHVGRHAGDGGNNFYLQAESDGFPIPDLKTGVWKTVALPAWRLSYPGTPPNPERRVFNSLYTFNLPQKASVSIRNIRLEGPKGVRVLDNFDKLPPKAPKSVSLGSAGMAGEKALRIAPGTKNFSTPDYKAEFNLSDYKVLAYDIQFDGTELPKELGFRNTALNRQYGGWHEVRLSPFYAERQSAKTELNGEDCYAEVAFSGYGTFDSVFVRRMVLTREGVLVLRDTLVPGPKANGWTGGSVWQLNSLSEKGANWFASQPKEEVSCEPQAPSVPALGLLAYFEKKPECEFGLREMKWGKNNAQTRYVAFSKLPLSAGKPVSCVTVVVPFGKSVKPAALADGISVVSPNAASILSLKMPGASLQVEISDKAWKVTR